MGNTPLVSVQNRFCCSTRRRVWVIGMAGAGKTSISLRLSLGKRARTHPTIVFDVEKMDYNGHQYTLYDWGYMCHKLWWTYDEKMHGIIFVIDSSDPEMLHHAAKQFTKMLKEPRTKNIPILVFANKQDRIGALSENQIRSALPPYNENERALRIQACSVSLGTGLYEGLEWLDNQLYSSSTKSLFY
ncbi:ADP-ribosylation factor 4-like [Ctenocephalides felis]|uniref:ADP-ribosylation factor 4-like n=1 Tax=Ctenocephalides felis TaxID=7515 RepID=UPI000E6E481F|nr:ADP-ribosylation factor 4-like [Ctenocephalides felis]